MSVEQREKPDSGPAKTSGQLVHLSTQKKMDTTYGQRSNMYYTDAWGCSYRTATKGSEVVESRKMSLFQEENHQNVGQQKNDHETYLVRSKPSTPRRIGVLNRLRGLAGARWPNEQEWPATRAATRCLSTPLHVHGQMFSSSWSRYYAVVRVVVRLKIC